MGAPERVFVDGAALVAESLRAGLSRPPRVNVAEWADLYRRLPSKGAAEPGRWRTDRAPYLREIMECLSPDHPAQRVVFAKSAQIGATECGLNWVGAFIGTQRGPMLAVQPTLDMAERWSKQRLAPMIEDSAPLRALIAPARARDSGNTVLLKEWPGGVLVIAGANSAAGLRSMPARYLFLDEIDGYPRELEGEGDPISLAIARTTTFGRRRKVFLVSTPTTQSLSRIWPEYLASDQRVCELPCPHCNAYQVLRWDGLHWPDGRPEDARYACQHCGALIEESAKTTMLAAHRWTPQQPGRPVPGFHINALYSPLGIGVTWAEHAAEWDRIKADAFKVRTFTNLVLGEVSKDLTTRLDWEEVKARAGGYAVRTLPPGCLVLTMGVDVQGDRLELQLLGHGRAARVWTLDYLVIMGDPNRQSVWDELETYRTTPLTNAAGAPVRISNTAVDSGYLPDAVLAYTRPRQRMGVFALKGASQAGKPIIAGRPTKVDYTQRGKTVRGGAELWTYGADSAKTMLFSRLEQDADQPLGADRLVHFPDGLGDDYYAGLTAEIYDTLKRRWTKVRPRNEPLDTWGMALAAAYHPTVRLHLWRDAQWDRLAGLLEPAGDLFATQSAPPAAPAAPSPSAPEAPPPAPGYLNQALRARRERLHGQ
jgi:phage terminase large subunit GpA-like protein